MMSEERSTTDDLGDELRALGANLRDMLQAAWDSDERKRAQQEIETGLEDLARTLRSAGQEFSASPTGQRLKSDVQDLHARLRTRQVDMRVRDDLVAALRRVNDELGKAAKAWSSEDEGAPKPDPGAGASEEAS
jgi:hypothetical protein